MSNPNCGDLLREVTRLYVRAQRIAADCCGTTSTQCQMLMELGRTGPLPMVELGTRLCLEKSWVSRAVDTLAAEGLVAKTSNPDDARSWLVALTPAGRKRYAALNVQLDSHAERLLADFSPGDKRMVTQALALILQALREDAGQQTCCVISEVQELKSCN